MRVVLCAAYPYYAQQRPRSWRITAIVRIGQRLNIFRVYTAALLPCLRDTGGGACHVICPRPARPRAVISVAVLPVLHCVAGGRPGLLRLRYAPPSVWLARRCWCCCEREGRTEQMTRKNSEYCTGPILQQHHNLGCPLLLPAAAPRSRMATWCNLHLLQQLYQLPSKA